MFNFAVDQQNNYKSEVLEKLLQATRKDLSLSLHELPFSINSSMTEGRMRKTEVPAGRRRGGSEEDVEAEEEAEEQLRRTRHHDLLPRGRARGDHDHALLQGAGNKPVLRVRKGADETWCGGERVSTAH